MTNYFHGVHNFMKGAVGNFLVERIDGDFYELVYVESFKQITKKYILEYVDSSTEIEVLCEGIIYSVDMFGNVVKNRITSITLNVQKSEIISVSENMLGMHLLDPNPILRSAMKDWYSARQISA